MADAGRGSAHFAETPDDAPGIFAAEFSDLVALVAQNVSVEIRPLEQVQLVGILNDQPTVPVPGGLQVALGDAHGEESRRDLRIVLATRGETLGLTDLDRVLLGRSESPHVRARVVMLRADRRE